MKEFKKIGVLTSGGDAPGMNCAIRAITRKALERNVEVVGIVGGYSGLINDKIIPMTSASVSNIVTRGGTMLYSDRCLEFQTEEGMAKAIATCKKHGIDAIVAIGGDGTFRGATDLTLHGIPTIGVSGTIDNDITATDYTVGFDTAMNTTMEAIDKFRDSCESHARVNIIEVMGRGCGQIALQTAVASGAIAVAIPEVPFDEAAAIERIRKARENGKRGMIVVVSEGCFVKDETGNEIPYSEVLTAKLKSELKLDAKFARLAHLVRGGNPTLRDRVSASHMGVMAVELLLEGKSNLIIAEYDGELVSMDILFALTTDRMYKNKLKDGDLEKFNAEQIAQMEAICEKRRREIAELYKVANEIAV
ncbi:MAG: 6-phosphofructokinase [Clostridia bacterium]|nr:6-phosphofructokinase [Clostridia bacterium]